MTPPVPPILPDDQNQNQTPPGQSTNLPSEFSALQSQVNQLTQGMTQMMQMMQNNYQAAPAPQNVFDPNSIIEDLRDPEKSPYAIAKLIQHETRQALKPVEEMRTQFNRANIYASVKNQVRGMNPMFAKYWQHIEPMLDNTFAAGTIDVNPQIVSFQAQAILGGMLAQNPNLFSQQAPAAAPMITPSGVTPPGMIPAKKELRPLSDNEELLRKQRGLTHEQFLQLQEGGVMIVEPTYGKKG